MSTSFTSTPQENLSPFSITFQKAYIAAQHPKKLPFYNGLVGGPIAPPLDQPGLDALVTELNAANIVFDEEIDYGGDSPATIMKIRLQRGIMWVRRGTGNTMSTEVLTSDSFSGPMPPDAIKTSLNLADYPPYPGTVAPVVAASSSVGTAFPGSTDCEIMGPVPPVGALSADGKYKVVAVVSTFIFTAGKIEYRWRPVS